MPARSPDHSDAAPVDPANADRVDDLDLGDLPGRWQLLAVTTFFACVALVFGVPWLLGHSWLWDHARLVGPVLGGVFFFGTQRWWFRQAGLLDARGTRLAAPAEPVTVATPGSIDLDPEALARLRRRAGWALVRWWGTWFALALCVLAIVVGNRVTSDVNEMIDSQPHQMLPVVEVNIHTLGNDGPDITVDVPGTGWVDVFYSDYVHPVPHVGDRIDVVVDPHDPTDVVPVAYRHSNDNSWWMGALILAGLLGITAYLGWGMAPASRRAARAVRRATGAQAVTVDACDDEAVIVRTAEGTWLRWLHGGLRTLRRPAVGSTLPMAGEVVPGGQAAVLYDRWVLWTGQLESAARSDAPDATAS